MEAKELRIGNYINFAEEGVLFQVVEIDSEGLTVENKTDKTWIELETFEGVIITEEWLLKFGFIIRDKTYSLNYGGESMRYAVVEKPDFILFFHGKFGFNTNEGRKNGDYCIQYVHQLQNLYFALTGIELKENETSK